MATAPSAQHRELKGALRGARAVDALADLLDTTGRRLELVACGLTRADAYTGAVVGAAIESHLAANAENSAQVWEPRNDETWSLLYWLTKPLPARSQWCGDRAVPVRDQRVLLPATPIPDPEAARLYTSVWLKSVAPTAGISRRHAAWLIEAGAHFLDNSLVHATESRIDVITAACLEPQGNDMQIVTVDLGQTIAGQDDPEAALRDAVARSREGLGLHGLNSIVELGQRRGADVSVRLAAGTARARNRGGRWRYESERVHVPGFVAGFDIHR
jgi:anti-sigma regulatory factor (Ser/Thr protein kinase)